ncbi:hypothetical protein BC831DRAFT_513255 [Entophlyctis helioformis]|nr:hypothetical protein BC831DRAFT_513255 [Entophlyctis helioformis]
MGRHYPEALIGDDDSDDEGHQQQQQQHSDRHHYRTGVGLAFTTANALHGQGPAPAPAQGSSRAQTSNPAAVHRLLNQARGLVAEDLSHFLTLMLNSMSLRSKETVIELVWSTLTLREQQFFDLPYAGQRRTEEDILHGLQSPWLPRSQVLQQQRLLQQRRGEPQRASAANLDSIISGVPAGRTLSASGASPPRGGFFTDIRSPANDASSSSTSLGASVLMNGTSEPPPGVVSRFRPVGIRGQGLGGQANAIGPARSSAQELEDQILSVLMEAIVRAERAAIVTERSRVQDAASSTAPALVGGTGFARVSAMGPSIGASSAGIGGPGRSAFIISSVTGASAAQQPASTAPRSAQQRSESPILPTPDPGQESTTSSQVFRI